MNFWGGKYNIKKQGQLIKIGVGRVVWGVSIGGESPKQKKRKQKKDKEMETKGKMLWHSYFFVWHGSQLVFLLRVKL